MTSPREAAIEALLHRRGIAGLFGRPEAEGDVAAIETVCDLVPKGHGDDERMTALDEAAAHPGTRVFRTPDGGLAFVASTFEGVLTDVLPSGSVEMVPVPDVEIAPAEEPVRLKPGYPDLSTMTMREAGLTPEHAPLRAVPDPEEGPK